MHDDLLDEFSFCRPYLTPGEVILWQGKPEKGHLLSSQDIFMIPFSILWCGFAIFWETGVILGGAPLFFCLFGIPFVCVGLYITVGRFFHMVWRRKHTAYVLTSKKIIRKTGKKLDMMDLNNLPSVHVSARADGTGTIRIGALPYYNRRRGSSWSGEDEVFSLENIANVARVHQILSSTER